MNIDNIRGDLTESCGCKERCNEEMNSVTVLKWRKKYHMLPMGFQQQQKLLELYQETLYGSKQHLFEGKIICK